ncbi:M20 family metallopeptidase [Corynebacterium sp. S7]
MSTLHNVVPLLSELIQIDTVSGQASAQRELQRLVAKFLNERGTYLHREGGTTYPWTLLSTDRNPEVLFACHVDVVPPGNVASWSRDPFSGAIEADRIYGRGSVDMKGGIAAAIAALIYAHEQGFSAGLLLTADEEIGILGASDAAPELPISDPKLVIIPEPTNNEYSLGHRGANWFRIKATGVPAHASTPEKGINAIELLCERIVARLGEFPARHDDYLGSDTISLGQISGGTSPNIVPESAELVLDIRTVGSAQPFKDWLVELCGDDGHLSIETEADLPPLTPHDTLPLLASHTDAGPQTYVTDGAVLNTRFPTATVVIWGPGERSQMHAVDESLDLKMLEDAIANYQELLRDMN